VRRRPVSRFCRGFLGPRSHDIDLAPVGAFPEGKFVVATFLSDARLREVSRRAAYVRNNGRLGKLPSFTIMSSRCTHVGCPTQPNGPLFMDQRSFARTNAGEVGLVPTQPAASAAHGSQFDTEGNRTGRFRARLGHSTATSSRFATAGCCLAGCTA
jgi:hypothetical protein